MHSTGDNGRRQGDASTRRRGAGLSRRRLIASSGGLAAPLLPRFACAAEFTWRIGHSAPANLPLHLRLVEAARTVALRSGGQMEITVYPDGQLGIPVGLLAQVRAGTIDAVPLSNQTLSKDLAVAILPTMGFAFAGYDRLWPGIDGDIGSFLQAEIKERLGLIPMAKCWDIGFRQITTSGKMVKAASDMAGLRLRTPPDADAISLFRALRALPVAMPLSALLPALTAREIDGQESILALVNAAGLGSLQSNCALTNHVWEGQWLCVNGKSWSRLPEKLRDIVSTAMNESALRQREDVVAADAKIRGDAEAAGMMFNKTESESFRAMLGQAGYYATWRTKVGDDAWALLGKYAGRLG